MISSNTIKPNKKIKKGGDLVFLNCKESSLKDDDKVKTYKGDKKKLLGETLFDGEQLLPIIDPDDDEIFFVSSHDNGDADFALGGFWGCRSGYDPFSVTEGEFSLDNNSDEAPWFIDVLGSRSYGDISLPSYSFSFRGCGVLEYYIYKIAILKSGMMIIDDFQNNDGLRKVSGGELIVNI